MCTVRCLSCRVQSFFFTDNYLNRFFSFTKRGYYKTRALDIFNINQAFQTQASFSIPKSQDILELAKFTELFWSQHFYIVFQRTFIFLRDHGHYITINAGADDNFPVNRGSNPFRGSRKASGTSGQPSETVRTVRSNQNQSVVHERIQSYPSPFHHQLARYPAVQFARNPGHTVGANHCGNLREAINQARAPDS